MALPSESIVVHRVFACHSSAPIDRLDVLQWCVELEGIAGKLELTTSGDCTQGQWAQMSKDPGSFAYLVVVH